MTTHNIKAELYIGLGRKKIAVTSWDTMVSLTDNAIDTYGSIWGERQVLNLGAHFNLYSIANRASWQLQHQLGEKGLAALPSSVKPAPEKMPGGSVSGNFGEVLTVMVLQQKVPKRRDRSLRVGHLCPTQGFSFQKCPDLLVENGPIKDDYMKIQKQLPSLPNLPPFLPTECKNSDKLGALRQIVEYWRYSSLGSMGYGYGLLSSIKYKNSFIASPSITFNLLVPKQKYGLREILQKPNFKSEDITIKYLKEVLHGF